MPEEGIIVTHRDFLPNDKRPDRRQLFVCVVADCSRHPFAQLHIVQNPRDPLVTMDSTWWKAAFIPHWPEAGLLPRDPARGDTFTNIRYYGLPERLAPQLRHDRFASRMRKEGFSFDIVASDKWNDYSDTDAVLAVRSFVPLSFHRFPASKLYNAWLAGVPALLGRESAYQAERRSELDYFEVRSADDVLRALVRLRDDAELRSAVALNCTARAAEVTPQRIAQAWARFFRLVAIPAYLKWRAASPSVLRSFYALRGMRYGGFVCTDYGTRAMGFALKQARALAS
jgi:hypothetical protein